MNNVNLLPKEVSAQTSAQKAADVIKKFGFAGILIDAVFIVSLIVFFLIGSLEINKINSEKDRLKDSIKKMQATEQQLFFAKDRLAIIKKIDATASIKVGLDQAIEINNRFPTGITIKESDISAKQLEMSITAQNTKEVTNFLAYMAAVTDFQSVNLTTFSYAYPVRYDFDIVAQFK